MRALVSKTAAVATYKTYTHIRVYTPSHREGSGRGSRVPCRCHPLPLSLSPPPLISMHETYAYNERTEIRWGERAEGFSLPESRRATLFNARPSAQLGKRFVMGFIVPVRGLLTFPARTRIHIRIYNARNVYAGSPACRIILLSLSRARIRRSLCGLMTYDWYVYWVTGARASYSRRKGVGRGEAAGSNWIDRRANAEIWLTRRRADSMRTTVVVMQSLTLVIVRVVHAGHYVMAVGKYYLFGITWFFRFASEALWPGKLANAILGQSDFDTSFGSFLPFLAALILWGRRNVGVIGVL